MASVSCRHCGGEHKVGTARCPKTGALLPKSRPDASAAPGADLQVGPQGSDERSGGPEGAPAGSGTDPFADWEPDAGGPVALRVHHGPTVTLSPGAGPVLLGRDHSTSPIAGACGDNVSWHHAEVRWAADGPVLVDLGSTNGTYVNGLPLQPGAERVLQPDDVVQLANDPPLRLTVVRHS